MTRKNKLTLIISCIIFPFALAFALSPLDVWLRVANVILLPILGFLILRILLRRGIYDFHSLGIGQRPDIHCFVCDSNDCDGKGSHLLHNLTGEVASAEEGELIVAFFNHGAILEDKESKAPRVKIGACDAHKPILARLERDINYSNMITKSMVEYYIKKAKEEDL